MLRDELPGEKVVGISAGLWHSLLLLESGKVAAMGHNSFGQLGLGDTEPRHKPTLLELDEPAVQVSAGYYHSMVLLESGAVAGFGRNTKGQLGLKVTTSVKPPRVVNALTGCFACRAEQSIVGFTPLPVLVLVLMPVRVLVVVVVFVLLLR